MRKQRLDPSLENLFSLFSKSIERFSGESKRSYKKALSSLQLFVMTFYTPSNLIDDRVLENWMAHNLCSGLSHKTVSFYLDRISALYSGVANRLNGGREIRFKELKIKLKSVPLLPYHTFITKCVGKVMNKWMTTVKGKNFNLIIREVIVNVDSEIHSDKKAIRFISGCLLLKAGLLPEVVKSYIGEMPTKLAFLNLCHDVSITKEEANHVKKSLKEFLMGEKENWFAMRLRPKVSYDRLLGRLTRISDLVKMPYLFYPCEEIAKRIGRKVVWKGKPVIRDVVFFKYQRGRVYHLFSYLYDIAWCYARQGEGSEKYEPIPEKAMKDFQHSLGLLTSEFEVAPIGELDLNPGDKVLILDDLYRDISATVVQKMREDEEGQKIYRVSLMKNSVKWNIGIDARLLKKQK